MATTNFLLFDENKANIMPDEQYQSYSQRLNGVQSGIASSMLNNKFAYQVSLMAYALAQLMNANGIDANDSDAVVTFCNNLSSSLVQKVTDKATTDDAMLGTSDSKWMTPASTKVAMQYQANVVVPSGSIFWLASTNVPTGYLLCDGSNVSRTEYASLFAVIGTQFGSGDGSTTFTLPNLSAAFIRGAGSQNGYSATFGQKQEATYSIAFTDYQPTWPHFGNPDKTTPFNYARAYDFANGGGNMTNYYVRPYNIALTPIIKT